MEETTASLEVRGADALDRDARNEICVLCTLAYDENFEALFDLLPFSTHVLARGSNGQLVSHAAWVTRLLQPDGHDPLKTAYVEAVATDPRFTGRGLGSAVMRRLIDAVVERDYELAALSPSDSDFYERLGWELWRGPLAIRTDRGLEPTPVEEEVMIFRLPRTPPTIDLTTLLTAEYRAGDLW